MCSHVPCRRLVVKWRYVSALVREDLTSDEKELTTSEDFERPSSL